MGTENRESCSQRDSAERKGYVRAHRSFNRIWKERDSAEPDILGKILDKDNLNRAYKRGMIRMGDRLKQNQLFALALYITVTKLQQAPFMITSAFIILTVIFYEERCIFRNRKVNTTTAS